MEKIELNNRSATYKPMYCRDTEFFEQTDAPTQQEDLNENNLPVEEVNKENWK